MCVSLKCYAKMHSHSQHILYDFASSLTLQVNLCSTLKLTQIMYKCRMCSFGISHTHIFNDGWEKLLSWRTVGTPYVGMTPKKNGGHIKSAQMTRSKCLR